MSLIIPFDQPNFAGKYEFVLDSANADLGDGLVLYADRESLLAFAALFQQLASQSEPTHVHIGYTEQEPQGPGVRIALR